MNVICAFNSRIQALCWPDTARSQDLSQLLWVWTRFALLEHLCWAQWLLPAPFQLQLWGWPLWGQCHTHFPSDCQTNHSLLCVSGCIKETQVDPNNEKEEAPTTSIMLLLTGKTSASSWLLTAYATFCIRKTLNVSLYFMNRHWKCEHNTKKRPALKKIKGNCITTLIAFANVFFCGN